MINSMMDGHQFVTVAVTFDERSVALVSIAADLCRRTGKKLHLLHVVEPWHAAARPLEADTPLFRASEAVEARARARAERHLQELAGGVAGLSVKQTVLVGKPAEKIGKEAAHTGSCLLIVGANSRQRRFLPTGYSTALSLMVTASVPVMSIDTTTTPRLPDRDLNLLLADDLSPQSEAAVAFAFDFAAAFGRATLHHLHINGLTLEGLRSGLETAAAAGHTMLDSDRAVGSVFEAVMAQYHEELRLRAAGLRDYLDAAGGVYQATVRSGQVRAELAAFVDANDPDVLVFGRHQSVHTRPFFLGRLPYGAMLSFQRPVIVVPMT